MNISPGPKQSSQKREKPTASRESVETSTPTSDGNDVQVLSTSVIGTVDHGTDGKTKTHSELVSSSTTTSYALDHDQVQKAVPRLAAAIPM